MTTEVKIDLSSFHLPEYATLTIIGPRRAGKSEFIKALIRQRLESKELQEKNLIILSPTLLQNNDYQEFKQAQTFGDKKEFVSVINDVIKTASICRECIGKEYMPRVFLVLDDCAGLPVLNRSGIMDDIAMKGRHIGVDTIIASQKLRVISSNIRDNSDAVMLFSPFSVAEMERYLDEYVLRANRKLMYAAIQNVFQESDYSFIVVDNMEKDMQRKLKKNGMEDLILPNLIHLET